jgi:hypothetical protein
MGAIALLLIGLLIYQQWFWSRQNQKLIDKLMSRNYGEYVQATKEPELPKRGNIVPEPLEDLNTLTGFGSPV